MIGQYEVPPPEGKTKRKYVRGKDKKEVASKLARAIADRDCGVVYDSENVTVGEYLDRWIVQAMLGHSSITITLDLYSHVLPDMQEKAVKAMDDILDG